MLLPLLNYASVGGATRHTVVVLCVCVCHYASVGGATRHTVIALSVILSVCYTIFSAHAEMYALKLAMQVELDIISIVN